MRRAWDPGGCPVGTVLTKSNLHKALGTIPNMKQTRCGGACLYSRHSGGQAGIQDCPQLHSSSMPALVTGDPEANGPANLGVLTLREGAVYLVTRNLNAPVMCPSPAPTATRPQKKKKKKRRRRRKNSRFFDSVRPHPFPALLFTEVIPYALPAGPVGVCNSYFILTRHALPVAVNTEAKCFLLISGPLFSDTARPMGLVGFPQGEAAPHSAASWPLTGPLPT